MLLDHVCAGHVHDSAFCFVEEWGRRALSSLSWKGLLAFVVSDDSAEKHKALRVRGQCLIVSRVTEKIRELIGQCRIGKLRLQVIKYLRLPLVAQMSLSHWSTPGDSEAPRRLTSRSKNKSREGCYLWERVTLPEVGEMSCRETGMTWKKRSRRKSYSLGWDDPGWFKQWGSGTV